MESLESLNKKAIQAAVDGNWLEAIEINKGIISSQPNNLTALNRLAFAYLQSGSYESSLKTYESIIDIDPNNVVAERNLKKVKSLSGAGKDLVKPDQTHSQPKTNIFILEPGKTRQVTLINQANQSTLNTLSAGIKVQLKIRQKSIEIRTQEGIYVGVLPDDISYQLRNLIKQEKNFDAYIKNIKDKKATIFLKETS